MLGEISPLGLSKLSSVLGSFLGVFGLSSAIGIGNVYWCVDEPRISALLGRRVSKTKLKPSR
jgi:hypothetical protein